jgi:hypothetical protein
MATTFAVKARQATRTPFGSPLEPDVNLQESGAVRRQSRGRNHPLGLPTGSQCRIDCRNLSGHVGLGELERPEAYVQARPICW